jgi:hypothetical protein
VAIAASFAEHANQLGADNLSRFSNVVCLRCVQCPTVVKEAQHIVSDTWNGDRHMCNQLPTNVARLLLSAMAFAVMFSGCVNLAPPWENARVAGRDVGGGSSGTVAVGGVGGNAGDVLSLEKSGGGPDATGTTQLDGGVDVNRQAVDLAVNDTAVARAVDASLDESGSSTFNSGTGGTGGDGGSTSTGTPAKTSTATGTQTATSTSLETITDTSTTTNTQTSPSSDTVTQTCVSTSYDAKALQYTDGYAESDGWYVIGSENFLWASNIVFAAGPTTVTVVARGDYSSGAWPTMEVTAEGAVIGTASVASTTMTAYDFTFTASAMTAGGFGVQVASGVGLHVKSVTIGCPTSTATVTATSTGTGTSTGTATATQTASATGNTTSTSTDRSTRRPPHPR